MTKYFLMVGERIHKLTASLIGISGFIAILATVLLFLGKLPWFGWLPCVLILKGFKYFQAYFGVGWYKGQGKGD